MSIPIIINYNSEKIIDTTKGIVGYLTGKKPDEVTSTDVVKTAAVGATLPFAWPAWLVVGGFAKCSGPPGPNPLCQDLTPQEYPQDVQPHTVPEIFNGADLESGVTVTWLIHVAACDQSRRGMYVKVAFADGEEKQLVPISDPDGKGGLIKVEKTFDKNSWDLQKYIDSKINASLYFWNPEDSTPPAEFEENLRPKNINLWLPESEGTDPCASNPKPTILDGFNIMIDRDPYHEVFVGEPFMLSFPRNGTILCDGLSGINSNSLEAFFILDNREKQADINGSSFEKSYAFLSTGCREISMKVIDTFHRTESDPYQSPKLEVCVNEAISADNFRIYSDFGEDGAIVHRPVELRLNFLTSPPESELTVNWEVLGPDGNPLPEQPLPGQVTSFIPREEGNYSFTASITSDSLSEPIRVQDSLLQSIGPFPAPKVEIDGNFYPEGGTTQEYGIIILKSDWRTLGPEDEYPNATCSVRVFHETESPIFNRPGQNCNDRISVPLPAVALGEKIYTIQVTVDSQDPDRGIEYYSTVKSAFIHVQSSATAAATADFTVATDYDDRIPFRPIQFNAKELVSAAAYEWEVIAIDYETPIDPFLFDEAGQTVIQEFNSEGIYTIRLTVKNDAGEVIDTVENEVTIYGFPKPNVAFFPDHDPIFTGEDVTFTLGMARSGGLWAEDTNASITWIITHDEPGGGTIDDSSLCLSSGRDLTCSFDEARTYKIAYTVTGKHDANDVYTLEDIKFVTVYPPVVAIPLAGISSPDWARVNEPVAFQAQNPDVTLYHYHWEFSDGATADGPAFTRTFTPTGTYTVRLTISLQSDPSVRSSATRNITIVPGPTPTVNVGIQAPFFAYINTPVPFTVPNPTPGATYNWEFGDGGTATGTPVTHPYLSIGQYQVRLTGNLGETTNSITHNITIGTTPVPMPVITETHNPSYPRTAGFGYNIIFNASRSYSPVGATIINYNITYGDGAPNESNGSGIFYHAYPDPGKGNSGSYTALLTITDSNDQSNSAYITVSVWGNE